MPRPHPSPAFETVAALAAARGWDPIDQICEHLIADSGATRVLITSISEDDIRTIVRSPTARVGSDGNCVATYGIVSQGMPHPRFTALSRELSGATSTTSASSRLNRRFTR
jgi:N-acyl-D-amino-acid deacylase